MLMGIRIGHYRDYTPCEIELGQVPTTRIPGLGASLRVSFVGFSLRSLVEYQVCCLPFRL